MNSHIKVGSVIRRTFALYLGEVSVLLSVAVISVLLPMAVLVLILAEPVGGLSVRGSPWLALAVVGVVVLALALFAGVVIGVVADVRDGGVEVSVRRRLRSVGLSVLGRLVLVGVVAALVVYALLALESIVVTVLILSFVFGHVFGSGLTPAGVILGVLASTMILLVPGLSLLTAWSVAAPVVVLERPRGLRALRRSRELVRGNGWRVFAAIAAVTISVDAVARGIERGVGYAFGFAPGVAATVVLGVLALPIPVILAAVLYFELREAATSEQSAAGTLPPRVPGPSAETPLPGIAASEVVC